MALDPKFLTASQKEIYQAGIQVGRDEYRMEMEDKQDDEDGELLPPAPDDVALALVQGLAASGQFAADGLPALIANAWASVPHFYIEREKYATIYAPMFFRSTVIEPPASDIVLGSESDLDEVNGRLA